MKVIKRNGILADFNVEKIQRAIERAMYETKIGIDSELSFAISKQIEEKYLDMTRIDVDEIQDCVEFKLMDSPRKDVAKKYIIYRNEHDKSRDKRIEEYKLLTNDFISKYKHQPAPMNQLGSFVFYRTYSRYLDVEGRREEWWETVRRAVEYNCSLVPTTKSEAQKLFENVYNLKQFLSGRTLWIGNTDVARHYPMANFNCSFQIIENFESYTDLFYLLMIGSGIGLRILKDDVRKLPKVRTNFELVQKDYSPVEKSEREDHTSLEFLFNNTAKITIGDSKEGWVQSIDFFFKILYSTQYRKINTVIIDYDNVRPKGERLKTFGGTASGHTSLKNMFDKIYKLLKRRSAIDDDDRVKLKSIDCMDIANIIGENVVSGGVRRTAEIMIVDPDDKECIEAKNDLYRQIDGQWIMNEELSHRQVSNNSIYYQERPSREQLKWQLKQMRNSGEPAFINAKAAGERTDTFNGVNPCGEILLNSKGLCNLTTLNIASFVNIDNSLDEVGLLEAQRLSARASYRLTMVELELPEWNQRHIDEKVVGCSITGWQDAMNKLEFSRDEQKELLNKLRNAAREEVELYASELGENVPNLVTTVKPEGTQSQLPGVSSGIHYAHSPYYLRRVRISSDDPLVKVCEELDYNVYPEVGQTLKNCTTKVVEFPVKSPEGRTKYDVSAIEQLEDYKMFMEHYVDHNVSITVHVRNNEWQDVEEWLWNNWDDVVAVTFLALDDNFYELLPYESITKEEYDEKVEKLSPFRASLISKYEKQKTEFDIGNDECESGICPIR
ncbi:ribonucleoside-triphosphate reductase, adenosylcobalamin-dependent [Clostridiaceae bacterium HSG29]|nr:ribonucleoside-triphosphate reductase, adenosylcobalamin-dependent [Clostridiaceae bacterium HSG29]